MAQQNSISSDVKAISMKLQNLLQIPSTEKVEPETVRQEEVNFRPPVLTEQRNKDQSPAGALNTNDRLNPAIQLQRGSSSRNFYRAGHWVNERLMDGNSKQVNFHADCSPRVGLIDDVQTQQIGARGFMRTDGISMLTPLKRQHNESTPMKRQMEVHRQQLDAKAGTQYSPRPSELLTNVDPYPEDTPYRREFDHISPMFAKLCEKIECPADIRNNITMFMQVSASCEDSRTTQMNYFVALDGRVKGVFHDHMIDTLNKKSTKFPRAKFYCRACNYHLDSILSTLNHIVQERHYMQEKSRKLDSAISMIPVANGEHTASLSDVVLDIANSQGMTGVDHAHRTAIYSSIKVAMVKNFGNECNVSLFGSSASGFGFLNSDVNINISFGIGSDGWTGNDSEAPVSPKTPGLNLPSFDISQQIPKIIKVLESIRGIDSEIKDSYSTKKPIVEFEVLVPTGRKKCVIQFNNTSAVWLGRLFEEYKQISHFVKPLVLAFRYFARVCEIDNQDNGLLPPHCYTIMVLHYLMVVGVVPCLNVFPKTVADRPFASTEALSGYCWVPRSDMDLGELWLGLLRYYALEFDYKDQVVTISRPTVLKRTEKFWNRRLSIEDPIVPQSNVARSTASNKICDYIIDRIKLAYFYFAIPRTLDGPMYSGIIEDQVAVYNSLNGFTRNLFCENLYGADPIKVFDIPRANPNITVQNSLPGSGICKARMLKQMNHSGELEDVVLKADVILLHLYLRQKDFVYKFDKTVFWDGASPPLMCKSCGAEGHVRKECPDETVPVLVEVVQPSPESLGRLNTVICSNYRIETLTNDDLIVRMKIADEIQLLLSRFYPDVRLSLFGSSQNRFGLHNSDLDICMTFKGLVVPPGRSPLLQIDVNEVLMNVVTALKSSGRMNDILPITSAKVPIVKFRHRSFKIEGDISLYNIIAVHNTGLLKAYADLDSRVGVLGCFLKKLVKICDISDASKASLSSYGYVLMLIHFLQRHTVPVLPVLQELAPINHPPGYPLPTRILDNANTYFFEDIARIGEVWRGYGRNTETVEQLWLAFLRYFTEVFDFEECIVTISQAGALTKKAKAWYTDSIAIEDPFDKTHNLGAGLSRRMSVHIVKTLQRFRKHFHTPSDFLQPHLCYAWYMDLNKLRGGDPPIDRQCRLCNRIGHFARSCTYVGKQDSQLVEDEEPSRSEMFAETPSPQSEIIYNRPSANEGTVGNHIKIQRPAYTQSPTAYSFSPVASRPVYGIPLENMHYAQNGFQTNVGYAYTNLVSIPYYNGILYQQRENRDATLLPGFTFFYNCNDIPRNLIEQQLLEMVKKTSGVSFEKYILRKAEVVNMDGLISSDQSRSGTMSSQPKNMLTTALPPTQEVVIINNGVNGHMPDSAYKRLMQETRRVHGHFGGENIPPQYVAAHNGYGFQNVIHQDRVNEASPLPPPPGFANLYP